MNTALLKLATRHSRYGTRQWTVPSAGNGVKVVPASKSFWPGTMSVYWPAWNKTRQCEELRGARLDWHKKMIRAALLDIIHKGVTIE